MLRMSRSGDVPHWCRSNPTNTLCRAGAPELRPLLATTAGQYQATRVGSSKIAFADVLSPSVTGIHDELRPEYLELLPVRIPNRWHVFLPIWRYPFSQIKAG
jgi:hypothetical protein